MERKLSVVVLAAGQGTRMKSEKPKVVHEVNGRPMILEILHAIRDAAPRASVCVVVGTGRAQVEGVVLGDDSLKGLDIAFALQPEQNGTGHAVQCAIASDWGKQAVERGDDVLVLPGDMPLLTAEMIHDLVAKKLNATTVIRALTTEVPDPTGYGRIVRKNRAVSKIVEQKDATTAQRKIREVGTSVYLFECAFMTKGLKKLDSNNAQGELYLTDLIGQAFKARKKIDALKWKDFGGPIGVNTLVELAEASRAANARTIRKWMLEGVNFLDPAASWVESTVHLAAGVTVYPGVHLRGATRVGKNTSIGANAILRNMTVGEDVEIKPGCVMEDSVVFSHAKVGPYAHLRPESKVGEGAKIGNFVELKKSTIGENTSIAHLSYLGDATVGRDVNIGCGFVTCNFDGRVINGRRKHPTIIEDRAFVGSDCQAVAPVRIGRGAYVGSGSTVNKDVPDGALAIARARQENKEGYGDRLRKRSEKAEATLQEQAPSPAE